MQGKSGMDMYKEFEIDRDQGNFDKLPELHAVLSGMKAGPLTASSSHMCANAFAAVQLADSIRAHLL